MLYRGFLFLLSVLNPKSWFKEKVWVNPVLLGHGESQYLRVGTKVFDNKGRLCEVVKQGKNGALRKLSHAKTEQTVAGWSFRKLAKVHFLWTRAFISTRAKLLGPSLKYHWMTMKFRMVIFLFRWKSHIKRNIRAINRHLWRYLGVYVFGAFTLLTFSPFLVNLCMLVIR